MSNKCHLLALRAASAVLFPIVIVALGVFHFTQLPLNSASSAEAAGLPVLVAAGTIACDPADPKFSGSDDARCQQSATSNLLFSITNIVAVAPLGDNQLECGSKTAYTNSYGPTWGRVLTMTYPAIGDKEYLTSTNAANSTGCDNSNAGAAGYFDYFSTAPGSSITGYYSYDIGAWHIVVLNSNCGRVGGCSATQAQAQWLEDDLTANPSTCIMAYWHQPLFSSGGHSSANVKTFWDILYAHGADVILNGHERNYERFAPQTPDGVANVNGIREFIVGTGGDSHGAITGTLAANSESMNDDTFGVLKLTLHNKTYDWGFIPVSGGTFNDTGTGSCSTTTQVKMFLPVVIKP